MNIYKRFARIDVNWSVQTLEIFFYLDREMITDSAFLRGLFSFTKGFYYTNASLMLVSHACEFACLHYSYEEAVNTIIK